jgi:hypothetical protein
MSATCPGLRLRIGKFHFQSAPLGAVNHPRVMFGPFRARATLLVQLGPVAIAYVHNHVVNDGGEVGDRLIRLASKTRHCGPARRSRCDNMGSEDAFADHRFSPSGWHLDDLTDRSCGCARAIVVPVERLLLTPAAPLVLGISQVPRIARPIAGRCRGSSPDVARANEREKTPPILAVPLAAPCGSAKRDRPIDVEVAPLARLITPR